MAQGAGQDDLGIYVKSIVKGGPGERVRPEAWKSQGELRNQCSHILSWFVLQNGKLTAGDQLLSVDGHSLVGISQER